MNATVARIVEIMFQDTEMSEEIQALRDEVMNNCQERYNDMVARGLSEDEAIAAVPQEMRSVFLMRDVHGLSVEQTAQALGVSQGTVKSRLSRAREKIARRLRESGLHTA